MVKVTKQIPHACPVCKGKGELGLDQAQHGAPRKYEDFEIYACHVCTGSCLIWEIREEDVPEPAPPGQFQFPQGILNPQVIGPQVQPYIGIPQGPITIGDPPSPGWVDGVTWATTNIPPNGGAKFTASNAFRFSIEDGVAKCESCKEPLYRVPAPACQRTSSHMFGN